MRLVSILTSIRPDLIKDAVAQGGSFVYFRLLEQTVEHNQKIYDHFSWIRSRLFYYHRCVMLVCIITFV